LGRQRRTRHRNVAHPYRFASLDAHISSPTEQFGYQLCCWDAPSGKQMDEAMDPCIDIAEGRFTIFQLRTRTARQKGMEHSSCLMLGGVQNHGHTRSQHRMDHGRPKEYPAFSNVQVDLMQCPTIAVGIHLQRVP